MIVSIMQPAYLPWLGWFDRVARSDLHVVLDSVPLGHQNRNNFTCRNRVRTAAGPAWLTVPVRKGSDGVAIRDVMLADQPGWERRHRETLRHAYGRAPHWAVLDAALADVYARPWTHLAPLLEETTARLRGLLGCRTPTVRASTLDVTGAKSGLILAICRAVGATTYVSGPFGRDYLDAAAFADAGIALQFHDYAHPVYSQGRAPFEPYLSVVDLLAHHGPDARAILSGTPVVPVEA